MAVSRPLQEPIAANSAVENSTLQQPIAANSLLENPSPDPELVELLMKHSAPPEVKIVKRAQFQVPRLKEIIRHNTNIKVAKEALNQGKIILMEENQLLDRVLYKNHNRFRNDRGYKAIQILHKSVTRFVDHLSADVLTTLTSVLPVGVPPVEGGVTSPLLPPSALAQYAALHVWLTHALCLRVDYCSRSAGIYALQRIALGHFWGIAAYKLGVISRIWALVRSMTEHVAKILGHVQKVQAKLPGEGLFSEEILSKIYSVLPEVKEKISKDEVGKKVKGERGEKKKTEGDVAEFLGTLDVDIGVKIRREDIVRQIETATEDKAESPTTEKRALSSLEDSTNLQKKKKLKKSVSSKKSANPEKVQSCGVEKSGNKFNFVSNLKTLDDLKNFLDSETKQRKQDRKSCQTRKMNQDTFKALKHKLVSDFNPKLPNKSIKQARKTLKEALEVN